MKQPSLKENVEKVLEDMKKIFGSYNQTTVYVAVGRSFSEKKDVNSLLIDGMPYLHFAILHSYVEVLKFLFSNPNVNPNIQDKNARTPLHCALQNECSEELLDILLSNPKTNINCQDEKGYSALVYACQKAHNEPVIQKITSHEDFDWNTSHLALTLACQNNYLKVVQQILKDPKANLNKKDENSNTPLGIALQNQDEDQVLLQLLLSDSRIDINGMDTIEGDPCSILCHVCKVAGRQNLVATILHHPNFQFSSKDYDLFYYACIHGYDVIVQKILEQESSEFINSYYNDRTFLQFSISFCQFTVAKLFLKDSRVDITKTDLNGNSYLHDACFSGNLELVQMMLKKS